MTGQQVFNKAMTIMDEVTSTGVPDPSTTSVYAVKAPNIIDMLQNELLDISELYNTYEISRKPVQPILGRNDYKEHTTIDLNEECSGSVQSYYFEVNGACTVYIEDYTGTWNTLETVTVTNINSYTAYKGIVTPTVGATRSRLRFSGSYYYNYTNYALFSQVFESESKIPDYRPYVKYTMPSDFYSIDQLVKEIYPKQYIKSVDYFWEGQKDLYISYDFDGNIRILYRPIPTTITLLSQSLQIDDVLTMNAMPYGLASILLLGEDTNKSNYFGQKYDEAKISARKPKQSQINQVEDIYGGI